MLPQSRAEVSGRIGVRRYPGATPALPRRWERRGTDAPLGSGHTDGIEAGAVHLFRVSLLAPPRRGCIVTLLRRAEGV
jgi:hypothetical protein